MEYPYELSDVSCLDPRRRADIREHSPLNGIDFVEYFEDRAVAPAAYWLVVTFLKDAAVPPPADLVGQPQRVTIVGGVRIVNIRATSVIAGPPLAGNQLRIDVTESGDFSTYRLMLDSAGLDPQLSIAPFTFKAGCPTDFDCRTEVECPPEQMVEPLLDYLAKDYASFRRLLLDFIPQRNPGWLERSPADLGMVLVEALAYVGDELSYYQDAVATEAYLDTARKRVSAKRHARLIDYRMHDGRNAWGFVQLDVDSTGTVGAGTQLLTRIAQPLRGAAQPPTTVVPWASLDFEVDRALRNVVVFETRTPVDVDPRNNELRLHTWGSHECCLPGGATGAAVYALAAPVGNTRRAVRPPLRAGDYILLEETKDPVTGESALADPAHRQVVRLLRAEDAEDPVYRDVLVGGNLQPRTSLALPDALPLVKIAWRIEDALTFPLCLSTDQPGVGEIDQISIVRGNVIPCDHGRSIEETIGVPDSYAIDGRPLEVTLAHAPLTFETSRSQQAGASLLREPRHDLDGPPDAATPAIRLTLAFRTESEDWFHVSHLMDSSPADQHFVVDVENDGRAAIRFGDNEYGRRPPGGPSGLQSLTANYRIGNGRVGNLGSGSLAHIVRPAALGPWPGVTTVRQPLPTEGGIEPESIEEVRQRAPAAFHAEQFRAVTEGDYERALAKLPSVAAAKCTFRWTGSWLTVFVGVHPRNPDHLITEPGGRTRLRPEFARAIRGYLTRYKLAGYDLEARTAQYVPLEIDVQLCIARGHFRGDVVEAVQRALGNKEHVDGSTGFFHPSAFAFGQPVYLSRLYAAIERIEGVDSASVRTFKRYWAVANNELEDGVIAMGPWEIARLDDDLNFRENGVLRLTAVGGL